MGFDGRNRVARKDADINTAFVIAVDEHPMRILGILLAEQIFVKALQSNPVVNLDDAQYIHVNCLDDPSRILNADFVCVLLFQFDPAEPTAAVRVVSVVPISFSFRPRTVPITKAVTGFRAASDE